MIREKINAIVAKFGRDFMAQVSDSPDVVGNEIITLITQEIEKVENPYISIETPTDPFNLYRMEQQAFEQCRQKILNLFRSNNPVGNAEL